MDDELRTKINEIHDLIKSSSIAARLINVIHSYGTVQVSSPDEAIAYVKAILRKEFNKKADKTHLLYNLSPAYAEVMQVYESSSGDLELSTNINWSQRLDTSEIYDKTRLNFVLMTNAYSGSHKLLDTLLTLISKILVAVESVPSENKPIIIQTAHLPDNCVICNYNTYLKIKNALNTPAHSMICPSETITAIPESIHTTTPESIHGGGGGSETNEIPIVSGGGGGYRSEEPPLGYNAYDASPSQWGGEYPDIHDPVPNDSTDHYVPVTYTINGQTFQGAIPVSHEVENRPTSGLDSPTSDLESPQPGLDSHRNEGIDLQYIDEVDLPQIAAWTENRLRERVGGYRSQIAQSYHSQIVPDWREPNITGSSHNLIGARHNLTEVSNNLSAAIDAELTRQQNRSVEYQDE